VQIPAAAKKTPALFKNEFNVVFTDDAFFRFFPRQWLAGTQKGALQQPFRWCSVKQCQKVLSGFKLQYHHWPRIIYNDSIQTTVSGVVSNVKGNTDFTFDAFISLTTARATGLKNNFGLENWGSTNSASQLFVKLVPGTTPVQVHEQLKKLLKKYQPNSNKDAKIRPTGRYSHCMTCTLMPRMVSYGVPLASKTMLYGWRLQRCSCSVSCINL
jgi:hypothetical protein